MKLKRRPVGFATVQISAEQLQLVRRLEDEMLQKGIGSFSPRAMAELLKRGVNTSSTVAAALLELADRLEVE